MATSADRILGNLPPTFAPLPRPTALSALVDAFGDELLQAQNALAAVMFAHWVDYADINTDALTDLRSIAALYGLAPRDDETIEGFREHLKRYVLTFLNGTVTVRGICRIVAEALGLVVADDRLDTWWNRRPCALLRTVEAAGDDAATLLFGVPSVSVRGGAAHPATIVGTVDLSGPVDLRGRSRLRLATDATAAATFDLAAYLDPASAQIDAIVTALDTLPGIVAESLGGRLVIRSAAAGAASTLELGDVAEDAAPTILGIAPHDYVGTTASQARIMGRVELPATLDLTARRYLRVTIDGTKSHEIDCAGTDPAATTPHDIVAAIQAEAGAGVAAVEGGRLVLSSPTPGLAGTVAVRVPTAGDATQLLLGDADTYARGRDAAPARASGVVNFSAGIDLSARANLAVAIDGSPPIVVTCVGAVAQKTMAGEIATAINTQVGFPVATQNGARVTLTSRVVGPAGRIRFHTAPTHDALDLIFGFAPRRVTGTDPTRASVTGTANLTAGADLRAVQRVQLAVEDGEPVIVDFAAAGLGRANVAPAEITATINAVLGAPIASTDGTHLTLTSPEPGAQGSVAIVPIETPRVRRFVSRAFPLDEASNTVLGTFAATAQGTGATRASLTGGVELHDGLDLRAAPFLRIAVDGGPPRDVDVASASRLRRAVLLTEIVQAIDAAVGGAGLTSVVDDHLVLRSPTSGNASKVAVLPNAGDAARAVFGLDPQVVQGSDARRVIFTGLTDLSARVDLSAADHVKLAIDGADAIEIPCAGDDPARTSIAEITGRLNAALGGSYASTDGTSLRLGSARAGSAGSITFLAPAQRDATRTIFGIPAGRTYHGEDATPATLSGARDLPATLDLSATPFLQLAVDTFPPVRIDCRGTNPAKATPAEILAQKISAAFRGDAGTLPAATATARGARVVVTATSTGTMSRIALQAVTDADASAVLFGNPTVRPGTDATPGSVTGTIDLRTPVGLSQRSILRLAVDGGRPLDIDISGAAPDRTFGDEIRDAIDAALPGVASIDSTGHLVVSSPTAGESSRIEVLPLRPIEVIEYPPVETAFGPQPITNGMIFTLDNDGAADATVTFTLASTGGMGGIDLIGLSTGTRVHVDAITALNAALTITAADDGGITATITEANGMSVPVPPERVVAAPLALTAIVPFEAPRPLARAGHGARPSLVLVDPLAKNTVLLESVASPPAVASVRVVAANPSAASPPPEAATGPLELLGTLHADGPSGELRDAHGAPIAHLRASAGVTFAPFEGRMVLVRGTWYPAGASSLLAVEMIAQLFDVEIDAVPYPATTLDARAGGRSLSARLAPSGAPRVIARDLAPADALRLPRGRSEWLLEECAGARFDAARFDAATFAGGPCQVPGVFDVSRFNAAADQEAPRGALAGELTRFAPFADGAPITVTATWRSHRPGAFTVNLPADLPARFGARFNAARFATTDATSESYPDVVFDPPTDNNYIEKALSRSTLVVPQAVSSKVPLGWDSQTVPFRQPRTRHLTGGRTHRPSAIYLADREIPRAFFGILAKDNGADGDDIAITVWYAGPARFDITVAYAAARFESASALALAGRVLGDGEDPLPALVAKTIAPRPVGVVQAKAAGIKVTVTRERK